MKQRIDDALMDRALAALSQRDGDLRDVIAGAPRCPLDRGRRDLFSSLAWSIIGQQLSTAAARTIGARVQRLAGGRLHAPTLARLAPAALRDAGLSAAKTRYLQGLARAATSGALNFRALAQHDDDTVVDLLTEHPGVGAWTAQMFLMFGLRRPDIAAPGDLGLQEGLRRLRGLDARPGPPHFLKLVEPWRPYRSIACWYLWRLAEQ